jgi:UDP-N-acetylmuramate--alanine ligase
MVGRHNIQNALSIIAVADELELDESIIRQAFNTFKGVKRRFTCVGVVNDVTVIDDYAHHPVEIKTVIDAAKQATQGRIWVVKQPHRYSRLHHLFEDFSHSFYGAHHVILAPVYGANEEPIPEANSEKLAKALQQNNVQTTLIYNPEELAPLLNNLVLPGDMILCLGAGNITQWAAALVDQLSSLEPSVISKEQVI